MIELLNSSLTAWDAPEFSQLPQGASPQSAAANVVLDGEWLLHGGFNGISMTSTSGILSVSRFDLATRQWKSPVSVPKISRRRSHKGFVHNGYLHVAHGLNEGSFVKDVWRISLTDQNDTVQVTTDPTTRVSLPACEYYNGKLYVTGGVNTTGATPMDIYDFASNTWSSKAGKMPVSLAYAMTTQGNGKIFYGLGHDYSFGGLSNVVYQYDIVADVVTKLPNLPGLGVREGGLTFADNCLWVFGGRSQSGGVAGTNVLYRLDLTKDTLAWEAVENIGTLMLWQNQFISDGTKLYNYGGVDQPQGGAATASTSGWIRSTE